MRSIPCTIKCKPLVLPWGRTPRLNSGVRVSQIVGFPSISLGPVDGPKWAPCLARVRGHASTELGLVLARYILVTLVVWLGLEPIVIIRSRPRGL
ncbi:hypothetical protein Tco_0750337, partial [Tanacetum coccineum]